MISVSSNTLDPQSEQFFSFTQTYISISREPVRLREEVSRVAKYGVCIGPGKPNPIFMLLIKAQGVSTSIDPLTHVWSAEHVIGSSGRSKLSQESQFEILLIDIGPNSPKNCQFS